jgi:endopeptidase Clp ATP-binding regulatory subunit ClpX
MTGKDDKFPDPKEVEKEIGEFLSEKFGGRVKLITPMVIPNETHSEEEEKPDKKKKIDFSLKPDELEAYLDQYVVKQSEAKAILATKVCTHFNRIKHAESSSENDQPLLGNIKNNILMIGPTGVGKTYMIKLIASKIGVPFVKGDATKFSETGYVGGDVEDLMRDLVREADDDVELAQYGIVYIDEIDKIASSRNLIGPDVSRTGVQRALLKPMEETEVDLKVPHDPISMLEEIDRYRKTGKRKRRLVNTKNILFIMSGAFDALEKIIRKRTVDQGIGFGASVESMSESLDCLKYVKPEDLIKFGFETEFVGRLPVISVFEELTEDDLFAILKNPNNPVILSKKLDFKAYGIDVKFDDKALKTFAHLAYKEGTGARALVSVIEKTLLKLEKKLPSTDIKKLCVTEEVVKDPESTLDEIASKANVPKWEGVYEKLLQDEKGSIREYVKKNQAMLTAKYDMMLTESRINLIAQIYAASTCDINGVMTKIRNCYDQIKEMGAYFCRTHDLNVTIHEDTTDFMILQMHDCQTTLADFHKKLTADFEYGFKLVRDRTGQNDFVITREALEAPEQFLNTLVKDMYTEDSGLDAELDNP